jgi:hypothetical protein
MPINNRITNSPLSYDPRFQTAFNGALSDALRTRIRAVKGGCHLTLSKLGQDLGFSASFVGNLMTGKKAIRTKHIAGLVRQLESLEQGLSDRTGGSQPTSQLTMGAGEKKLLDEASLEDLAQRANNLGFDVTFAQRAQLPR